jgi:hypothetical protein
MTSCLDLMLTIAGDESSFEFRMEPIHDAQNDPVDSFFTCYDSPMPGTGTTEDVTISLLLDIFMQAAENRPGL